MNPVGRIKLVSELLDLPLIDSEGRYCGIVDDVDLSGEPGKTMTIKALLVGPGAYAGRLPRWTMWLVRKVAGDELTRVPWERIRQIGSTVEIDCPAKTLGLQKGETVAHRWIPHKGAI